MLIEFQLVFYNENSEDNVLCQSKLYDVVVFK